MVGKPDSAFVDALIAEWQHRRDDFFGIPNTLYFGGGTPSLLRPEDIDRLIEHFSAHDAETTLEANPEDLSATYVDALSRTHVNRISLGVQSFDDKVLRMLGRKHSGAQAKDAITELKSRGFDNVSVDLIVGVPDEDRSAILRSLDYLIEMDIKHISTYLLTIEDGTHFARKNIAPLEDHQAEIYEMVQRELIARGFMQYDISSFARAGFMSKHNQAYWSAQDYLGLGPGAHSMRALEDGGVVRTHNAAGLASWLKDPIRAQREVEALSPDEALRESLAFGLRNMHTGMDVHSRARHHRTNLPHDLALRLEKFCGRGWLLHHDDIYRITTTGALFADAIMREILG